MKKMTEMKKIAKFEENYDLAAKIKTSTEIELEDLPDLYPFCVLPRETKILCYVGCIPKNIYPDFILRMIFVFDIILCAIYSIFNIYSIIFRFSDPVALSLSIFFLFLNLALAFGSLMLRLYWFEWFHKKLLRKWFNIWLWLRTAGYVTVFSPAVVFCGWFLWDVNRFYMDMDGRNLQMIEKVVSGGVFLLLTVVIGYLGILGWIAKNSVDKLFDNFESLKNRIMKDYERRRKVMGRKMGAGDKKGSGQPSKLRNLGPKN